MRNIITRELGLESEKTSLSSPYLWFIALVLSVCFPAVELQLIVLSLIIGAKWIVDGRPWKDKYRYCRKEAIRDVE